jgi:hypothetical protein
MGRQRIKGRSAVGMERRCVGALESNGKGEGMSGMKAGGRPGQGRDHDAADGET